MNRQERSEHNKRFVLRYATIHHEGVTEEEIRAFTKNELYIKTVMSYRRAFPDYSIMIEDITAEGDFVIIHGVVRGTHKAEFHGIPATFRKVEMPIMTKFQVVDDMIINAWPMVDQMDFLEQLGALNRPV